MKMQRDSNKAVNLNKISKLERECEDLRTKVEDLVKYVDYLSENLNDNKKYSEYIAEEFAMFMNVVQLMMPDLPLTIKETLRDLFKIKNVDFPFLKELYDNYLLLFYCDSITKAYDNKEDLDEVDSLFRKKIIVENRKKKIEIALDEA